MRICIIGAGAIGGLLAVKLHAAGEDVSVIARGAHLAAIREAGLRLTMDGVTQVARVPATSDLSEVGLQDLIILAVKAHQVSGIASQLPALYGAETMVMTAQNGIPWWYFEGKPSPFSGRHLKSVDPDGTISQSIPVGRVIGTVVYPAAEITSPGCIQHIEGNRFSLAEIDDRETPRILDISARFQKAGFKSPVISDIRYEIWTKLWGNLSFNPISALTHSTLEELCTYPLTGSLLVEMMREAQAIGEALGIRFRVSIDKRIAGGAAVGAHKTSMLQDVEAGRPIEAEALIGSIIELGQITGIQTPHIETVFALVKLLDDTIQRRKGYLKIAVHQD